MKRKMDMVLNLNGYEWGEIVIDGASVSSRPLWDWHAGCMGTDLFINDEWVDFGDKWTSKRPWGVARMIVDHFTGLGWSVNFTKNKGKRCIKDFDYE